MNDAIRKSEKETGSYTIEAVISLPIFMLSVLSILFLINLCTVQAKVQQAINCTAREISQYSYFYHLLSVDDAEDALNENKKQAVKTVADFNTLLMDATATASDFSEDPTEYFRGLTQENGTEDLQKLYGEIQTNYNQVKDIINDPISFLKSMASWAGSDLLDYGKTIIAVSLSKSMTRRHFGSTDEEANAYLEGLGVMNGYDGMNFNMSTYLQKGSTEGKDYSEDIRVVVFYKLNVTPLLPMNIEITVCQSARTRAWLGGDIG